MTKPLKPTKSTKINIKQHRKKLSFKFYKSKRTLKRNLQQQKIDFKTKIIDNDKLFTFTSFEQDVEEATMLWYLNAGYNKFKAMERLPDTEAQNILKQEIQNEILSNEEIDSKVAQFFEAQGRGGYNGKQLFEKLNRPPTIDAYLTACGACGVREMERNGITYTEVEIESIGKFIKLSASEITEYRKLQTFPPLFLPINNKNDCTWFYPYKLISVYESTITQELYHLHQELIHFNENNNESTFLCPQCTKEIEKKQIPKLSLANGIDFGYYKRLPLTQPNLLEMYAIARLRLYHSIVKIEGNNAYGNNHTNFTRAKMKGHTIVFPQDAPKIAALAMLLQKQHFDEVKTFLDGTFILQLVGPSGEIDKLSQHTLGTTSIPARSFVVYQWLSILQNINKHYKNDPPLPSFQYISIVCNALNQRLLIDTAVHITDPLSLKINAHFGDDVAEVRSKNNRHHAQSREQTEPEEQNQQDDLCCPMKYSFVTSVEEQSKKRELQDTINSLVASAQAFGIHIDKGIQEGYWQSRRDKCPASIFDNSDFVLAGTFPHVFPLGKAFGRTIGTLTTTQAQHLLLQFTNVPATCQELIFHLFDEVQCHLNILTMSHAVKRGKLQAYEKLVKSSEFRADLKYSIQNPESKRAKILLLKVLPILSLTTSNISNLFQNTNGLTKMLETCKRMGPPSCFITIAPDDKNDPSSFRCTVNQINNFEFPAVVQSDFFEALKNDSKIVQNNNIFIPCGYKDRMKALMGNPIAAALEYQQLINNILIILLGLPPSISPCTKQRTSDKEVRTTFFNSRTKGICGYITAYYGISEAQQRGTLHFHLIIWGGLTPALLQKIAEFPELCNQVSSALETIYTTEIPRQFHMKSLIFEAMKQTTEGRTLIHKNEPFVPPALLIPPTPLMDKNKVWNNHAFQNTLITNVHEHRFTCRKGKTGKKRCRESFQRPLTDKTQPLYLQEHDESVYKSAKKSRMELEPISTTHIPPCPIHNKDALNQPVLNLDNRCIFWEMKRQNLENLPKICVDLNDPQAPQHAKSQCIQHIMNALCDVSSTIPDNVEWIQDWLKMQDPGHISKLYKNLCAKLPHRNGYVVEYNKLLTNVTGSNTCVSLLGATVQAKGAIYYLGPYMQKDKANLADCLIAIEESFNHIAKYPSTATNTGTLERTTQHWLTRVKNTLSTKMEISDVQAAACLIGFPTDICSEIFQYYGAIDAVHFIDDNLTPSDTMDTSLFSNNIAITDNIDCKSDTLDFFTEDIPNIDSSCAAPFYTIGYDVTNHNEPIQIAVPYNIHYNFRGEALQNISRQEYQALIQIKQKESKQIKQIKATCTTNRGRKKSKLFSFHQNHPLHLTHCQVLRSRQPTLIFLGTAPKFPGPPPDFHEKAKYRTWKEKADAFAKYYLAAFRPETHCFEGNIHDLSYDWDSFCSWISHLNSSSLCIDKFRLQALQTHIYGLHTIASHRDLTVAFRGKNTDAWTQDDISSWKWQPPTARSNNDDDFYNPFVDLLINTSNELSTQMQARCKKEQRYLQQQQNVLDNIFGSLESPSYTNTITTTIPVMCQDVLYHSTTPEIQTSLKSVYSNICHYSELNNINMTETNNTNPMLQESEILIHPENISTIITNFINEKKLSEDQQQILFTGHNNVLEYLLHHCHLFDEHDSSLHSEAPLILLTGKPGTGKSYVGQAFCELVETLKLGHIACTAHYGMTAFLAGGSTLCSLFSMDFLCRNSSKIYHGKVLPLNIDAINELKAKLQYPKLNGILIDEGSVIDPVMFAIIHLRCCQMTGNLHLPFGGIPILLIADMSQLGPPGNISLHKGLIKLEQYLSSQQEHGEHNNTVNNTLKYNQMFSPTSLFRKGCELFQLFRRHHLITQHRAPDDPSHMDFLNELSMGQPISLEKILCYDELSPEKIALEPQKWRFAPILVATNRERINISFRQAIAFAKANNTQVIRWTNNLKKWENQPLLPQNQTKAATDPAFWQIFVRGAPAFETVNIHPELGLANGTPITLDSISLTTKEEEHNLQQQLSSMPPGSIITLDHPPEAVIVTLTENMHGLKPSKYIQRRLNMLRKLSLNQSSPIHIPFLPSANAKWQTFSIPASDDYQYSASRITIKNLFPFELAFAMTVHKAQGRTLRNVILALSNRFFDNNKIVSYEYFYVAMSRIRHHKDILFLFHDTHNDLMARIAEIDYLTNLQPCKYTHAYYAGFHNSCGYWNWQMTKDYISQHPNF